MMCDGHGGVEAANFVTDQLYELLEPLLPSQIPDQAEQGGVEDIFITRRSQVNGWHTMLL